MGPSAAWFYEGQLRLHRNNNNNLLTPLADANFIVAGGNAGVHSLSSVDDPLRTPLNLRGLI